MRERDYERIRERPKEKRGKKGGTGREEKTKTCEKTDLEKTLRQRWRETEGKTERG